MSLSIANLTRKLIKFISIDRRVVIAISPSSRTVDLMKFSGLLLSTLSHKLSASAATQTWGVVVIFDSLVSSNSTRCLATQIDSLCILCPSLWPEHPQALQRSVVSCQATASVSGPQLCGSCSWSDRVPSILTWP